MFSSENIDSSPSPRFQDRLATEKKVNVYFVPGYSNDGRQNYAYMVVSSAVHDQFMEALNQGMVPDYAVIVEMGFGEPTEQVKNKMKTYYGFDHDYLANNDNFAKSQEAAAAG